MSLLEGRTHGLTSLVWLRYAHHPAGLVVLTSQETSRLQGRLLCWRKDPKIENLTIMEYDMASSCLRDETLVPNTAKLVHLCNILLHLNINRNPLSSPSKVPLGMVEKQVLDQLKVVLNIDVGRLERIIAFIGFNDPPIKPYIDSGGPAESRNAG